MSASGRNADIASPSRSSRHHDRRRQRQPPRRRRQAARQRASPRRGRRQRQGRRKAVQRRATGYTGQAAPVHRLSRAATTSCSAGCRHCRRCRGRTTGDSGHCCARAALARNCCRVDGTTKKRAACVATSGPSLGRKRPRWACDSSGALPHAPPKVGSDSSGALPHALAKTIAIRGSIERRWSSGI